MSLSPGFPPYTTSTRSSSRPNINNNLSPYNHPYQESPSSQSHHPHVEELSLMPNATTSPAPPGFASLSNYGITLRSNTGSAPPPGFFESENRQRQALRLDPSMLAMLSLEEQHQKYIGVEAAKAERTSSFVNLAAVLGEGLAESIEDSVLLRERISGGGGVPLNYSNRFGHSDIAQEASSNQHIHDGPNNYHQLPSSDNTCLPPSSYLMNNEINNNPNLLAPSQFRTSADGGIHNHNNQLNNGNDINNYQRQTRHSASRLIGKIHTPQAIDAAVVESAAVSQQPMPSLAQTNTSIAVNHLNYHSSIQNPAQIHEPNNDFDTVLSTGAAPSSIFVQQSRMSSVCSSPDSLRTGIDDDDTEGYEDCGETADNTNTSENTAILAAIALLECELEAEEELSPFLRDVQVSSRHLSQAAHHSSSNTPGSRGIAILGVATLLSICGNISVQDIRSTCEAFGAIDNFRGDFTASRGVIFINYYDLRCAQYAAQELLGCLYRLAESEGVTSRSAIKLKLHYCTPFNLSSATDESMIVFSNLPNCVDEDQLAITMRSYGAVKAVHYQVVPQPPNSSGMDCSNEEDSDCVSYLVEFYDIQDAKQALLELESVNPWSSHVKMEVGKRNPSKRRQGKDLLAVIAKWRHGGNNNNSNGLSTTAKPFKMGSATSPIYTPYAVPTRSIPQSISPGLSSLGASNRSHASLNSLPSRQVLPPQSAPTAPIPVHGQPQQVQLVVNADGQYSYVIVNQQQHHDHSQQHQHQHQRTFVTTTAPTPAYFHPIPHVAHTHQSQYTVPAPGHHIIMPHQIQAAPIAAGAFPYPISVPVPTIGNVIVSDNISVGSSIGNVSHKRSSRGLGSSNTSKRSNGTNDVVVDETNLALDIGAVKRNFDKRTSLMVRNIPNKYTQQMLLAEFSQDGHGSHKIDFFYLPIDFKNKCNRGYAFVNFTHYVDIVAFHEQYNGKSWKIFNSDKICNITYARIQGKAALLKRFEHSALLMEKEEDYRPLVFVSHGKNKGQREKFPTAATQRGVSIDT